MNLEVYMKAYMFELEEKLNANKHIFKNVNFQFEEANSDQELKKTLKSFILSSARNIEYIKCVKDNEQEVSIQQEAFYIEDVLSPEDYTEMEREEIRKSKDAVYVNPDLILKIIFFGEAMVEYIELKSTKNDKIPGSSIQQIVPNEWVIFIKHSANQTTVVTGQYKNSISGTMQFPDRSPRPQVSFNELLYWVNNYRRIDNGKLIYSHDDQETSKYELLLDWQKVLSDRWMSVLMAEKKKIEPWFNNNIRKFSIQLLDYYDDLEVEQQKNFKKFILNNIEVEK